MESYNEINVTKFLTDSIQQSVEIYINQSINIFNQLSENNVHDFRVCIRRLLAQLSLINVINSLPDYMEFKSNLKSQVKFFNELRDIQIQILKTQSLVYQLPELYKYYHYLIDQEQNKVQQLKIDISTIDFQQTALNFKKIANYLPNKISVNDLKIIISEKMNLVIQRHKLADKTDLVAIHKTRLAFKKFRYSIEFLSPILNYETQKLLQLKAYQTRIGLIQDNVVYLNNLNQWQNQYKQINHNNYEIINSYLISERQSLIDNYFNNFDEIYSFWN